MGARVLTTKARAYYGKPHLVLEASDHEGVRAACKLIERQVKPKDGERVVLVAFRRERDS